MKLATFPISSSKPFTPRPPPPYLSVRFNLVPSICTKIFHRTSAASVRASATPARDRVVDFGKYKGRMLGSLPSGYLKWISSNLRAGETEEWARLADRVLSDPVYRDRLEWEAAENILSGNAAAANSSSRGSAVSELLEISQSFGWDNEDKSGWGKIDFGLLGTSKGGRIPRVAERERSVTGVGNFKEEQGRRNESGDKRGERRERVKRLREKTTGTIGKEKDSSSPTAGGAVGHSPFPGRESLLKKLLNRENL